MQHQVIEGTWEEVSKAAARLDAGAHVRLEVVARVAGKPLKRGMFPSVLALSEADFEGAGWGRIGRATT